MRFFFFFFFKFEAALSSFMLALTSAAMSASSLSGFWICIYLFFIFVCLPTMFEMSKASEKSAS